jgi:hypothetical protein
MVAAEAPNKVLLEILTLQTYEKSLDGDWE